jgi:TetR/AcrR family transcriptional repressor of nem operon
MLDWPGMARTREFDYDRALHAAMRLFWENGYSNTSLRALLKAMRIGESYLTCLKHYNDRVTRIRLQALKSGGSAGDGVRSFFKCVLDELDDPKTPRVCLMAGSLSSEVLAERDLERYVIGEMKTFQRAFVARFEKAIASGELPRRFPAKASAQVLITYLQGLFRVIRVLNNRGEIEEQLNALQL